MATITSAQRDSAVLAECFLRFIALSDMYSEESLQLTMDYFEGCKNSRYPHESGFLDAAITYLKERMEP